MLPVVPVPHFVQPLPAVFSEKKACCCHKGVSSCILLSETPRHRRDGRHEPEIMTCEEFETKFMPLSANLYALAKGLLGNDDDAQDAVQETYLKMWRMADRLPALEKPEAFFATTLRNECLMALRHRRPQSDVDDMPDEGAADADMERVERRGVVARLLRGLTAKARRVVVLRHLGEYSNREVAELTGETEEAVRQQLSRARRQMRRMLDDEHNF